MREILIACLVIISICVLALDIVFLLFDDEVDKEREQKG